MIKSHQLARFIQIGLVIVVALMPFHAFLATWLGQLTGQPSLVQAWKEIVLGILALVALYLAILDPAYRRRLRQPWILAAGGAVVIALAVTAGALALGRLSLMAAAFGVKTDLEFLVAAAIAAMVTSNHLIRWLLGVVATGAVIVAGFVVCQVMLLPPLFLTQFGYGPQTVPPFLYLNGTSNTIRYAGTLGGPNQLGAYLIVPISMALAALASRRPWFTASLPLLGFALFYSYSRSAWIGALVAGCLVVVLLVPARRRRLAIGVTGAVLVAAGLAVSQMIVSQPALQESLFHTSLAERGSAGTSDAEHAASLVAGATAVLNAPLGHGLGSAGPATFRTHQPLIIENQFLQWGYEAGWAGLLAYLAVFGLLIKQLLTRRQHWQPARLAVAAAMLGIAIAGLVIPVWDDSTTALITFILAGSLSGAGDV